MMTNVFFSHTVEKWVYPADAPPRTFSWCFVAYVEEHYSTLVKIFSFLSILESFKNQLYEQSNIFVTIFDITEL